MQEFMGQAAQLKRGQGTREDPAKYRGVKLLGSQTANWDRPDALKLMETGIQSYVEGGQAAMKLIKKQPCEEQVYILFRLEPKTTLCDA
jgi:hypothetical protein